MKVASESDAESELCGIEFFERGDYERFLKDNPLLRETTTLRAGDKTIIILLATGIPTREVTEFQDSTGRVIGKFLGPDALELTYQISCRPEAFE